MNYIYSGINARQYEDIKDYEDACSPEVKTLENAVVLPAIKDDVLPWGRGGIVDACAEFVEESRLDDSFGSPYDFDESDVPFIDETVIYLGIMPRQWGHVIIDVLSKLWYSVENPHKYRIVYCGLGWTENGGVYGSYKQLLRMAGIEDSDLLYITRPARFRKVLIPSRTLGFEHSWNKRYLEVIDAIEKSAETEAASRGLKPIPRIYFSRQDFSGAQKKEVGEEQIVSLFRNNGFEIVSPENYDAVEQVYLFHHCDEFVCLSGTLAHNAVFAKDGVHLTILNRTWALNPPQIRINQMKGINAEYVDVYDERELGRSSGYRAKDDGVHMLSVNENLVRWCTDHGLSCEGVQRPGVNDCVRYTWLYWTQPLRRLKHRFISRG